MSKIKVRFYAQALYDLTKDKTGNDFAQASESILKILQKNRQLKLWPQVLASYADLLAQDKGMILATVKTEKVLTTAERAKIIDFLRQDAQVKDVELTEVLAPVGAGVILETAQKRWDLSLTNQIEKFKQQLIN